MLPEKKNLKNNDDIVLFSELSEVQKELYEHILALPDFFHYQPHFEMQKDETLRKSCTA